MNRKAASEMSPLCTIALKNNNIDSVKTVNPNKKHYSVLFLPDLPLFAPQFKQTCVSPFCIPPSLFLPFFPLSVTCLFQSKYFFLFFLHFSSARTKAITGHGFFFLLAVHKHILPIIVIYFFVDFLCMYNHVHVRGLVYVD